MKYGRRKWVRRQRQQWRANREDAARHTDEQRISIEIMTMALARFRQSDEWQAIGMFGRWISMWKRIGKQHRQAPFLRTLDEIYKHHYPARIVDALGTLYWQSGDGAETQLTQSDSLNLASVGGIAAWIPAGDVHVPVIADSSVPRDRMYALVAKERP